MRTVFLAIGLACLAGGAYAADAPQFRPVPAWVKPIPIPDKVSGGDQGTLLQVSQARFSDSGDEIYDERAIRIQEPSDLTRYGNVVLTWSPDRETLVFHKLELIRDGHVIDQLDQGRKVQVLHRETNLEMAMFDGALTATVQLEGLQVGDVVHLAVSREVHDPVLKGHSQFWTGVARPGKIGRVYLSASWPAAKPLRWRATAGIGAPRTSSTKEGGSLVVDMADAEAPLAPRGAPARFGAPAFVQMSDFASWSDVSALMAPLFDKAATLEPDSPLRAEIAKIKSQSSDPKVQASAALKLVEDRIRYMFIGLNNGNLVPAAADETWRRRFGDCKAKTALLLALLRGLGVQAQPALVDTTTGDALAGRLPSVEAFDHVAVKAVIGGKTYWLDGTRLGDGSLDALETPNYHWMLPVQAAGAQLEALKPSPYAEAHFSARLELDASAGLDAPAKAHGEHQWRADQAQVVRLKLQAMSATERERAMRGYWQQAEPWITPSTVAMRDDGRAVTLVMDGSANISWAPDSRGRTFVVTESSIGGEVNFQRLPGPDSDAPFAVDFPSYTEGVIKVTLPNKGQGFVLINGAPIDQMVAGMQYRRTARIDNGAALIETRIQALNPEFPFAEAAAAASTLRTWGMHAVMIASNAALADDQAKAALCLNSASPDAAINACKALLSQSSGTDGRQADIYFAIGRGYGVKNDWSAALENFSKALSIRPDFAAALGGRAAVLGDRGDLAGALADFDHALALDAKDAGLWGGRGYVLVAKGEFAKGLADLDKAIALTPANAWYRLNRGEAYRGLHDPVHALAEFDEAIRLDPKDPAAYFSKGRMLFEQKSYGPAEKAFDQAVALQPKAAVYWGARGLARANQKRFAESVSDYDEALKLDPTNRGLLRFRADAYAALGQAAKAAADRLAASRLQPQVQTATQPPPLDGRSSADQVRVLLARGRAHSERKEYDQAIADFDQALQVVARHPDVLLERGKAYAAKKEWQKARADFDEVLKMRPQDVEASVARSLLLAQAGNGAKPLRSGVIDVRPPAAARLSDMVQAAAKANAELEQRAAAVTQAPDGASKAEAAPQKPADPSSAKH